MTLAPFFKAYLGRPTLIIAGGALVTLGLVSINADLPSRSTNEAIIILLLTIEMWLFPYIMLPAAFLVSERLPWNKKSISLWNGEGMNGLVIGIFVYAYFPGASAYLGFIGMHDSNTLLGQIGLSLLAGAIFPFCTLIVLSVIIMFPGEGER